MTVVDEVVARAGADVIYAHAPNDTHQDHVATSAAALAAGRRLARVLFYQSPSTTMFNPTVFVDVERSLGGKLAALRAHWSQVMQCAMVDLETVEVGARYWGSRAKIAYAEAFESPRFVWEIGDREPAAVGTFDGVEERPSEVTAPDGELVSIQG